jgi:hypothetical protein
MARPSVVPRADRRGIDTPKILTVVDVEHTVLSMIAPGIRVMCEVPAAAVVIALIAALAIEILVHQRAPRETETQKRSETARLEVMAVVMAEVLPNGWMTTP